MVVFRQSSDLRSQPRKNHSVSLTLRKEFAATTAKLLKNMKNRCALGWAPGRPKAKFIKAVSGGLGFPWVSQGIRCKAHNFFVKNFGALVFQQPGLRPGLFLSI